MIKLIGLGKAILPYLNKHNVPAALGAGVIAALEVIGVAPGLLWIVSMGLAKYGLLMTPKPGSVAQTVVAAQKGCTAEGCKCVCHTA